MLTRAYAKPKPIKREQDHDFYASGELIKAIDRATRNVKRRLYPDCGSRVWIVVDDNRIGATVLPGSDPKRVNLLTDDDIVTWRAEKNTNRIIKEEPSDGIDNAN